VAVFNGAVEVNGASGKVDVEKKHSATLDLAGSTPYTLANNSAGSLRTIGTGSRISITSNTAPTATHHTVRDQRPELLRKLLQPFRYGMMWQPYSVGAGWDPFMNGAWMWYPGAGYAWISSYPWGWTPYRYAPGLTSTPMDGSGSREGLGQMEHGSRHCEPPATL